MDKWDKRKEGKRIRVRKGVKGKWQDKKGGKESGREGSVDKWEKVLKGKWQEKWQG